MIIGKGVGPPVQIRGLVFTTGPASLGYVWPKKLANGGTPTHHHAFTYTRLLLVAGDVVGAIALFFCFYRS